jgi:hypothetical protein
MQLARHVLAKLQPSTQQQWKVRVRGG